MFFKRQKTLMPAFDTRKIKKNVENKKKLTYLTLRKANVFIYSFINIHYSAVDIINGSYI